METIKRFGWRVGGALLLGAALAMVALPVSMMTGCTSQSTVTNSTVAVTNLDGTVSTIQVASTNVTRVLNVPLTVSTIKAVVPLGISIAVQQDPKAAPYIQDAVTAINAFALGTNYSPAALGVALSTIPNATVQKPQTVSAIAAGVGLYEAVYAQVIEQKVDQVTWLRPVLSALADALQQGLGPVAVPTSP